MASSENILTYGLSDDETENNERNLVTIAITGKEDKDFLHVAHDKEGALAFAVGLIKTAAKLSGGDELTNRRIRKILEADRAEV
jgi:hypothetical protein